MRDGEDADPSMSSFRESGNLAAFWALHTPGRHPAAAKPIRTSSRLGGQDREKYADFASTWLTNFWARFGYQEPPKTDTAALLRSELKQEFDPEKSRRLNKLLLARVFPDSLRRGRVNAIQVFTWRPVKMRSLALDGPMITGAPTLALVDLLPNIGDVIEAATSPFLQANNIGLFKILREDLEQRIAATAQRSR